MPMLGLNITFGETHPQSCGMKGETMALLKESTFQTRSLYHARLIASQLAWQTNASVTVVRFKNETFAAIGCNAEKPDKPYHIVCVCKTDGEIKS